MIRLERVSRSFRDRPVLADLSLHVPAGSFVALMGESGSGKSTLLNLVTGIDRPDAGRILVGGVPLTELGEEALARFRRRKVGFVFQFFNLLPGLSVRENVEIPLLLAGRTDTAGRVAEVLEEVGLRAEADRPVHELSGGEQQRVAIARAVVHDPPLVVADEPTGSLDRANGDRVLEMIRRLSERDGRTVLMATHSARVAGRADRILRLEDGTIREDGA